MAVSKREYLHPETRKPAWGYDFVFERKRHRRAGFRTEAEAVRAEQRARERLGEGKRLKPVQRIKFPELYERFGEQYRQTHSEKNCQRENYRAKRVIERFANQYVDQISADQIKRYIDQRVDAGMAPRGVNLELVLLRRVYKFAIANGYAVDSPAKQVPYQPCQLKRRSIPTPEQFAKFMEEAGKTRTGQQMIVWLWSATLTGMRPSELLFLEWNDCDFSSEKIIVRPKPEHGNPLKKDAGREIEMHARVKELLLAWREEWTALFNGDAPPHQWVFVHPANPKMRSQGFRTAFRHASARAGLTGLRPYDLRHLFCSFALMNGIDRNVVREWMGHKSFQMIDLVYSHSLADYRRQEMSKMQIALPSVGGGNNQPNPAAPTS